MDKDIVELANLSSFLFWMNKIFIPTQTKHPITPAKKLELSSLHQTTRNQIQIKQLQMVSHRQKTTS
jgi:hypothetical protein